MEESSLLVIKFVFYKTNGMTYFTTDYLDFFKELAANNHKDWFDSNRKRYEESVKKPFSNFVSQFISELAAIDSEFNELTASECVFRINRDIRFSNDKTPYKSTCSAVVAPGGKKSRNIKGLYFEFGPENIHVYGGVYEAEKEDIYLIREGISRNLSEFESLISATSFVQLFNEIKGEKNKLIPKEFKEVAEDQPLIYNKQWYFMTSFPSELLLSNDLMTTLVSCYNTAKPIEQFFNQCIQVN
jgi:uncharacterized protein (TIGR02453 family)